ncbi:MAG TPA: acyltransferase [Opitutaceae bacterium]
MDFSAPLASSAPAVSARESHDVRVDVLRGLAALGVALYHFSRSAYLGQGITTTILQQGYLGVHAFFVVSGYVIPLALARIAARAKQPFRPRLIPGFLIGRWIRLYPAFAASAVLSIVLWYGSALLPGFRGGPPNFSWAQIASNATLSCDVFNLAWINPVFWTLAIETQYYVAIALCFPLLVSRHRWLRWSTLLVWIIAPLLSQTHGTLFPFGATFAVGLILYGSASELFSKTESAILVIAALTVTMSHGDYPVAIAKAVSLLFLCRFPAIKNRWILGLGTVSYSLYLVHVPIGGRVINLSEHFTLSFPEKLIATFAALIASIIAAVAFYCYVERPSHEASRRWMKRHGLPANGGEVSSLPATR